MSAQPQPPTSARPQPRGSFVGRLAAALLVILITTALSLGAVVAGFFSLGFTPDTPRQLSQAQVQLSTAQAESAALQTRVADLERRASDSRESLDEVRAKLAEISGIAGRLAESDLRSATLAAEARASRDAVALFATAEAGRAGLLSTLQQRSERVERFVQRLGDISQDAASDLAGAPVVRATDSTTATASPPAGAATPSLAVPTAPASTASSSATASPAQSTTPTAAASPTGSPTPSTGPTGSPEPSASPTRTPTPSTGPTRTPASTPTLGR